MSNTTPTKLPTPSLSVTSGTTSAMLTFTMPPADTGLQIERLRSDGKWIPWRVKLGTIRTMDDVFDFVGTPGYTVSYRAKMIPQNGNPNTESDYSPVVSCVIGTPATNTSGLPIYDLLAIRAAVASLAKLVGVVLIVIVLTGCTDHIPDTTQKVGGGSINPATGVITVGGCVPITVLERTK